MYSAMFFFFILGAICSFGDAELTPPYFNLATGRKIYASATCGVNTDGPELYCKLVGANTEHENQFFSVIQGQVCDTCDFQYPEKSHPPENAIDGKESWWQSPPLSRGMKYNEVNLTIDFGQEFHVAYLFIRMGNSPRPGIWTLEKSSDYGKTWTSWQHFSDTPADCESYFGRNSYKRIQNDDDVICTTEYSKIVPLENGEIPVMLLNDRPSANNYFNSTALQEWTRATNVRIRLLRTKNLLGHLMSVARQDPTVTRRYFYSIKDISIGGRCMCNGHADTCDVLDPTSSPRILACRCQHRTCGIQCNECCSGFEQKKWRQNTNARPFQCEPCNCLGHSNQCIYDEETDKKRLSLDIHGKYEGGGICQNCQHNTEGINCNKCKPTFYRPYGKLWNETDVCHSCNCINFYSTGNCEEETGRCECRKEFQTPNCDSCAYGYFGYPDCKECECYLNGTEGYYCEVGDGTCPCKHNFAGIYCKQCAQGYYEFPVCKPCKCNQIGSISDDCDKEMGQCQCLSNFGGKNCDQCKSGYFSYPSCTYCNCDIQGTETEICDKDSGKCLCRDGFGGPRCDQCLTGYYNYPACIPCNCSILGSASTTCDITGKCTCLRNFAGKQCTSCSTGYYSYPDCLPCNCTAHGSEGISCNSDGQCICLKNFDGKNCEVCKEGNYNFPACEECNCDPAGVIAKFGGCGSVPAGELCQCKERVTGRICDQCKALYWNLNINNGEGCEGCDCHLDGTIGTLDTCDFKTGQCTCKPFVQTRQCVECLDGTFDLFGGNLFGCKDCSCDIGGSRDFKCDKTTGQCNCHPRISGRTCTHPLTTHFFPTLYQFQFEYEDGYTPSGAHVRYQFDENMFPDFHKKGYAVLSPIQNEVINEVNIFKSSVYRMVIRFKNPTNSSVIATILITSDNPNELDQQTKVLLKQTNIPKFVTVSNSKGEIPSPIVLDPGRYTISIKTNKNILLDYFVLLPAAYYEASILTRKIENPCEIDNLELCKNYKYPTVAEFLPSLDPFITENDKAYKPNEMYVDTKHLSMVGLTESIPLISETQKSLKYLIDVPQTGKYVIVIDYITDPNTPDTYFVKVRKNEHENAFGTAILYPCVYMMICRAPVIDDDSREKTFFIDLENLTPIEVHHDHEDFGRVAIHSITAIPIDKWSADFIKPSTVCVIKDGKCVASGFRSVPESKKIEFEIDHEDKLVHNLTFNENAKLVLLNQNFSSIKVSGKVPLQGHYVIILKYHQPYFPKFITNYSLVTERQTYKGKFQVKHCPSYSGCRAVVTRDVNIFWFDIDSEFTFTITNNNMYSLWLDYMLIVPSDEFNHNLLEEDTFDETKEFIQKCGQDHFYINLNASDFCKKAVFSLTADYNNGALPCNCDYDGSTSFECDPFGGQCPCKPNIIGRQCEACRTGFYGFPDCKHCDCPLTALCQKDTGECICPPHVTGERCDQCEAFTYGFHQIIGCEECNCNPMGVTENNLQCDLYNGSCGCRPNIEGRACDRCANGFYNFPHCETCRCNLAGTTFEVCDKNEETCFCKKNVVGQRCENCADGTYYLQSSNPHGCTNCFCFGKTTRCESAYLRVFNVSLISNHTSANSIVINEGTFTVHPLQIQAIKKLVNDTIMEIDFSLLKNNSGLIYFNMLESLQNQSNHLTSYGGYLSYKIFYLTGLFGNALYGADVILRGKNKILMHQSYEQPVNSQKFHSLVRMIETNFQTLDKKPVSRADFMLVLKDLSSIYVRASYWEQSIICQLSDAYITMANEDEENYQFYQELPIEKCDCPPGYTGFSCEDCSPGYYRISDDLNGGYCVPCQCNGHAETCDYNTGICKDCKHNSFGDHCEMCIEGYHGNATYGTPHDCMICACPLPYGSNNFAKSCEISTTGVAIHCECKHGYAGERCQSCAPGYFGEPELMGGFCKICECSGNIDPSEPGACDTVTGECLMCLNNTYGQACNLCAPGYYGDAIKLKDCKNCECEELGTLECDSLIGTCNCHENVIGDRCDRCKDDHYGYDSGLGCQPCNCGSASFLSQCDDHNGECLCKPGATGRQCDRCAVDYWNYTAEGCVPCLCNKGYSRGFGCNAKTGQCECLPGVVGEKCDSCPHRWVLIKNEGCFECNHCQHALLDMTEKFQQILDPVIFDFRSKALAYFTTQKLNFLNDLADKIEPEIKALDPNGVNLTPARQEIDSLEKDAKNMGKHVKYVEQTAQDSSTGGVKLLKDSWSVLNQSQFVNSNVKQTFREVEMLSMNFDSSASTGDKNVINEAERILKELNDIVIDLKPSNDQLDRSNKLFYDIEIFILPVKHQKEALGILTKNIDLFEDKLEDLHDWSVSANTNSGEVEFLNEKNKEAFANSKFDTVANQSREIESNIDEVSSLRINGKLTLEEIQQGMNELHETLDGLKENNKLVDEELPKSYDEYHNVQSLVIHSSEHVERLIQEAENLDSQYSNITTNSKTAIRATTSYSDIIDSVIEAEKFIENGKLSVGLASKLGDGITERSGKTDQNAREILVSARKALQTVQLDLQPRLNRSTDTVYTIAYLNNKTDSKLNEIYLSLERIPENFQHEVLKTAGMNAANAHNDAREALAVLKPIIKQIPKNLNLAKKMPIDVDTTNKDIAQVTNQVDRINVHFPQMQSLIDGLHEKQKEIAQIVHDFEDNLEKLKRQISSAREIANSIKVGVTFHPNTVLELKAPENLPLLATTSKISTFFNTEKSNGFLLFIGNENKSSIHGPAFKDFIAIEIENGYPVLTIDIGNGPEKIISDKYVSDGQWYQIIIDRTGNNIKLIIREELPDRSEKLHETEHFLPGSHSVFNVDKESRIFVGGYQSDFMAPKDLKYSSFEGRIEDLKIGEKEVGMWNFIDGEDNTDGSVSRDKLINQETPTTGYRFNGNGYVIIDAKPFTFRMRSSIHFRFKASKDTKDGIMFYAGRNRYFIAVELRNGGVYFQYKLGQHVVQIGTEFLLNDDKWHRVEAEREGRRGVLKIDGNVIYQEETPAGTEENLKITDFMYFGGTPTKNNHTELINKNFNGCIDDVQVSGIPVDLSRHLKAFGVRPACPEEFSSVISYQPGQFGFLKANNVTLKNNFQISLKFRTKQRYGVLFYATNSEQNTTIGLTIDEGLIILKSLGSELNSFPRKYNDGHWHVVTITYDNMRVRLSIDDTDELMSSYTPPAQTIDYSDIYFGGVPKLFMPPPSALSTLAYFTGCISDATLNGQIVNFALSTEKMGTVLESCLDDLFDYDVNSLPIYYPTDENTLTSENNKEISKKPQNKNNKYYDEYTTYPAAPSTITSTFRSTGRFSDIINSTMSPVIQTQTKKRPQSETKTESACKLSLDPELDADFDAGYRFGITSNSRVEFYQMPVKIKKSYEISLQFKTEDLDGLLFYASDARHTDFISLYLNEGKIYHVFRSGPSIANISSRFNYNDGAWHNVLFSRQQNRGRLIIDGNDENDGELNGGARLLAVQSPFYVGGVDPRVSEDVNVNLKFEKGTIFNGCIRNVEVSNRPLTSHNVAGVIPCSEKVEKGIFFGKNSGFIKLRDRFRVGAEMTISFDIKPRTTTGLLLSVHGKKAYFILQMINGTINFTVDNGEGPIVAVFSPYSGESFCDGQWRTVQAIKSQYVITLTVNSVSSQPAIGSATSPSTETSRPLFMGGHPHLMKIRGLTARKPYHGCIRNVKIKENVEVIRPEMTVGDVQTGVCPIN